MTRREDFRNLTIADIQERYFKYLSEYVWPQSDRNPSRSYMILTEQLYRKKFVWTINNDDNREADGIALRDEFAETVPWGDIRGLYGPCNVLEMLVALAKRADFMSIDQDGISAWFWKICHNLKLNQYTDEVYIDDGSSALEVDYILDTFMLRKYNYRGVGGPFPLKHPDKDQRKVEIWYQMSSYLQENEQYDE